MKSLPSKAGVANTQEPALDVRSKYSASQINTLMRENEDCGVVVMAAGMPDNAKRMRFWERLHEDPKRAPKPVLCKTLPVNLKRAVADGAILGLIVERPDW